MQDKVDLYFGFRGNENGWGNITCALVFGYRLCSSVACMVRLWNFVDQIRAAAQNASSFLSLLVDLVSHSSSRSDPCTFSQPLDGFLRK